VHDEINISVPEDDLYRGKNILEEIMCEDSFRVPMRTSTVTGANWGLCS
jgi:DNA polymerase I-like protein with 3'-5' exonuclease and polymerase domains